MSKVSGNGAATSSEQGPAQDVAASTTVPTGGPKREALDVEVRTKRGRRKFSAAYKQRVVREAASCGEVGGLLRREGLYSSHLTTWRREIELRELSALAPKKRGPKPKVSETDKENAALRREIAQLKARAERAELLVEIQKKVASLLGIPLEKPDEEQR